MWKCGVSEELLKWPALDIMRQKKSSHSLNTDDEVTLTGTELSWKKLNVVVIQKIEFMLYIYMNVGREVSWFSTKTMEGCSLLMWNTF